MSKIIEEKDGVYTRLNFYEKFIQMGHDEKRNFLKFLGISSGSLITLAIPLIIGFKAYIKWFVTGSLLIWILLIGIYLFFYKEPKVGFAYFV